MISLSENIGSLSEELEDPIEDDAENDDWPPQAGYAITSFGVDFDVAGLVRRLQQGDVKIPEWQRSFVWNVNNASSFIESLLLGLPVPGIFMGQDSKSRQYYVIDGQQRLRSLQGFYERKFPDGKQKFQLKNVVENFTGLTYDDLSDTSRRDLDNSLIHATIVRQDAPEDDDTSMYQIFKRLNSGGRVVNPQEIRCAIYQGALIDKLRDLNDNPEWRVIVGKRSQRMKDQELILRFMAMLHEGNRYKRSMAEFLNVFVQTNRNPSDVWMQKTANLFEDTVKSFAKSKGSEAFRVKDGRAVNAAIFDSMSVGLANRIQTARIPDGACVRNVHDQLIRDDEYLAAVTKSTSQESSVNTRLRLAKTAFADA